MSSRMGGFFKKLANTAVQGCLEPSERIVRVGFLGRGLEFAGYLVRIDRGDGEREVVARVAQERVTAERRAKVQREVAVLEALGTPWGAWR